MIGDWSAQPDISARSVLVTIIGDTVVPVGASLWMHQMLQLASVFGFSDRLVRTSMTRLVNDGWLDNERVGRQSKYHLTELALSESTEAAERIYGADEADWSGEWTLVFFANDGSAPVPDKDVMETLRWHGFVRIGRDVFASPSSKPDAALELVARIAPGPPPAVATAMFDELDRLSADGFFMNAADTADQANAYQTFVDRYEALSPDVSKLEPREAFAYRTMLVHDLRRIRLRWPDPPPAARPPRWAGDIAVATATELYPSLSASAADWLTEVFGGDDQSHRYPTRHIGRFGLT